MGDMSQGLGVEIPQALPRIDDLVVEGIVRNGIDREIASGRRVFDRQKRIAHDLEALVPQAVLGFAARQGNIHGQVLDLDHTEAAAYQVELKAILEHGDEAFRSEAEDLDIDVTQLEAQE